MVPPLKSPGILENTSTLPDTPFTRTANPRGHWRLLHGEDTQESFAIKFHDFALQDTMDWTPELTEQSVVIWINLHGEAEMRRGSSALLLNNNEVAISTVPPNRPRIERIPSGRHCFYTLTFSRTWLSTHFESSFSSLKPEIASFLRRPTRARAYIERFPLPLPMLPLRLDLLCPPVSESGAPAWYHGKLFEILSHTLFEPKPPLTASKKRNQMRTEQVRAMIEENFENPPLLDDLAERVNVSSYHLCRMFQKEFGVTISQYLRSVRMEKAAHYLRDGMSVTDTSAAVGYSNVSAFIKAFSLHHCTTPARWAMM